MKRLTVWLLPALCALSMILVSCDAEDWQNLREDIEDATKHKGCICTFYTDKGSYKQRYWPEDMQQRGVSSCSALQSSLMQNMGNTGSVHCKKAKK